MSNTSIKMISRFAWVLAASALIFSCQEKPEPDDEPNDGPEETGVTIAEVLAAEAGSSFELENVIVVGANTQGVLLGQKDTYIYAFSGSEHGLAVGDKVTVSGTTSMRNGLMQFGSGCTIEKTGTAEVKFPDPEALTPESITAYMKEHLICA